MSGNQGDAKKYILTPREETKKSTDFVRKAMIEKGKNVPKTDGSPGYTRTYSSGDKFTVIQKMPDKFSRQDLRQQDKQANLTSSLSHLHMQDGAADQNKGSGEASQVQPSDSGKQIVSHQSKRKRDN